MQSMKCCASKVNGSAASTLGICVSPVRTPACVTLCFTNPLSCTTSLCSAVSSNTTIFLVPITVNLRLLCGSSQLAWTCASLPPGNSIVPNTTSATFVLTTHCPRHCTDSGV